MASRSYLNVLLFGTDISKFANVTPPNKAFEGFKRSRRKPICKTYTDDDGCWCHSNKNCKKYQEYPLHFSRPIPGYGV